jgi:hypothetical protein
MPSTDPTAATERREFRTRFPWAALVPWWVPAAVWLWTLADVCVAVFFPIAWLSPMASGGVLAFSLAGASLVALGVARAYLLDARRVLIAVTGDGIVVTDRRWRTREIPWGVIQELRLHRWQGPTFGPMLRLVTSTGTMKLPELVVEPELLKEEIITRAGLTEVHRGRFRFTYRRAHASPSPPYPRQRKAAG